MISAAKIAGPQIDWAGLSPLIAVLGGALVALMLGLLRSRALRAPALATFFLIVTFATLAMPGSSNFVGEFLILLGVFEAKLAIALIASTGVVLAAFYALRLYIRSMHNRTGPRTEPREMTLRDGLVLVPLVLAILAIALFPQFALERSEKTVSSITPSAAQAGEVASEIPEASGP